MTNNGVFIFNPERSKIVEFSDNGLSLEGKKILSDYIVALESGDVDTVSFEFVGNGELSKAADALRNQLEVLFAELGFAEPPNRVNVITTYTRLHVDARKHSEGESVQPILRFHASDGSKSKRANIPEGIDPAQFDAFFILGRMKPGDTDLLMKSLHAFDPSVMIDQSLPSWTLFRLIGDKEGRVPSVAHGVLPRKVVELGMQNGAVFSEFDGEGVQTLMVGDEIVRASDGRSIEGFFGRSADGNQIGVAREFLVHDFSRSRLQEL